MKSRLILFVFCISVSSTCIAQKTITIIYGSDYKPFAWGEEGVPLGVQRDFVEEILAVRLGINVIHETCPWARCQVLVEQGVKDGFFTVPTAQRATYTITSKLPFYETHFVMHSSKKIHILNR